MFSLRHLRTRSVAILLLLAVSGLTFISIGEIFKVYTIRPDGVRITRRDGSTITFSMPWKARLENAVVDTKAKAVSPVFGELLNGVTNVADALLRGGVDIADNVVGQGSNVLSKALDGEDKSALISSILGEVNRVVNQATIVVGEVVEAATSIVGVVLSDAASPSNVGVLTNSRPMNGTGPLSPAMTTPPMNVSPGNSTRSVTMSAFNITTPPVVLMASRTVSPITSSCPPLVPAPCPEPQTVSCTETWHSTHYAETATLFSFMSVMTVTCTETISICPSNPQLAPNIVTLPWPSPGLIACGNGVLAKRWEDCTVTIKSPMNDSTSAGHYTGISLSSGTSHICSESGCPCPECHQAGGGIGSSATRFMPPPSNILSGFPDLSSMAMSTSNVTIATTSVTSTATAMEMVICTDGSLVMEAENCINGVLSPGSAFATPRTPPIQALNSATGAAADALQTLRDLTAVVAADVTGVMGNLNELSEPLLNTVLTQVTTALAAANGALANNLPISGGVDGFRNSVSANINAPAGNLLSGVIKAAKTAESRILGGLPTTLNGSPTILPIVATVINGVPTILPILDMMANGVMTAMPIIDNPAGLMGGSGSLMGKRDRMNTRQNEPAPCDKHSEYDLCMKEGRLR